MGKRSKNEILTSIIKGQGVGSEVLKAIQEIINLSGMILEARAKVALENMDEKLKKEMTLKIQVLMEEDLNIAFLKLSQLKVNVQREGDTLVFTKNQHLMKFKVPFLLV